MRHESFTADVGVLGLGKMGSALARTFLASGRRTAVWNRTAERADPLGALGAVVVERPNDLIDAVPVIVACVRDYESLCEVLHTCADQLAGRTLINLTSGSSTEAREMANHAAHSAFAYLDGAIMMTPPAIGGDDTVILYSGDESLFERHADLLRLLGGGTTFIGTDPGLASLYDVALLGMMWSSLNGFLHALALVGTEGVTAEQFLPFALGWHRGVGSFMPGLGAEVDRAEFEAQEATLDTQLAPVRHLVHESVTRGIDVELPNFTRRLIEQAIAAGHGLDSYARVVDQLGVPRRRRVMLRSSPVTAVATVNDLAAAEEFYGSRLGLSIAPVGGLGLMLHFAHGGRAFVFSKGDRHRPSSTTFLAFEVEDIDRTLDELHNVGIEPVRYDDPAIPQDELGVFRGTQREDGPDIAWFHDPAGNTLSIESRAWAVPETPTRS